MIIIVLELFEQQHNVRPRQLGLKTTSSGNAVLVVKYMPQSHSRQTIQVHHPLFNLFIQLQLSNIHQRLFVGTRVQPQGGFQLENPKSFAGSSYLCFSSEYWHHSHHRYHPAVPGDYQLPVCSSRAVLSSLGIRGREQLNLQFNSLACLLISELLHVSGILSDMGRLTLLQILTCIRHFLH